VLLPQIAGTPGQIADALARSFENGEADGFIISGAYLPGAFVEFVDWSCPNCSGGACFVESILAARCAKTSAWDRPSAPWCRRMRSWRRHNLAAFA
jgi:hypothetical protein